MLWVARRFGVAAFRAAVLSLRVAAAFRAPDDPIGQALSLRYFSLVVRPRLRLYIEGMNVAFELPDAQAEKLRREAERLGVAPTEPARAALPDLLAEPDEAFQAASDRVLRTNEELCPPSA